MAASTWCAGWVAVLSTGDELVEPGLPLGPGRSTTATGACWSAGCSAWVVKWSMPAFCRMTWRTRACLAGLGDVDLILSTGGVSVGEADYLGLPCAKPASWRCGSWRSSRASR
jgi:molybdopterin molybdotransferase